MAWTCINGIRVESADEELFQLMARPDTEETIDYAKSLPLDMLKFGVTITFPGNSMFREYRRKGLIVSYD